MTKTKNILKMLILVFLIVEMLSLPSFGQGRPAFTKGKRPSFKQSGYLAGPGMIISNKPYKGMKTETKFFPFVMYQKDNFYFRGPRIGYKFYNKENLSIDAIVNWRFGGYEKEDSPVFTGMDDRDMTAELGAVFSFRNKKNVTRFSFLNDVMGKHKGQILGLSYGKTIMKKKMILMPSIGLNWLSDDYVDYYYGVKTTEATATRAAYKPSAAINPYIALNVSYRLKKGWNIFSMIRYEKLDSEISDSPIVDKENKSSFMFGLMKKF